MHCGVSVIALKMPKLQLQDQIGASILTYQILISFKIVIHILPVVKDVSQEDLERMSCVCVRMCVCVYMCVHVWDVCI